MLYIGIDFLAAIGDPAPMDESSLSIRILCVGVSWGAMADPFASGVH